MLTLIQREEVNTQEIKDVCEELDVVLEHVMRVMDRLFESWTKITEVLISLVKR